MRRYLNMLLFPAVVAVSSCGLDNYDAPESTIYGRVVYNGEPIGVRGTGEAVQLQLYQDGYELRNPIPVYVGQDGTFEARVFDGEYKLVTRDNNGPWVNDRDTTIVNLRGTANVDVPVTPFYTLSNVQLSLSGSSANASFQINEVAGGRDIEYVMILVGKTSFVDDVSYTARLDINDVTEGSTITGSLDLTNNADFNSGRALFARVGLRPAGKDQAIYSQVVQLR
ncbi:DUF3823 domain-containing protein [Parapedobacter sp. ISTM3]|uniref:DUF3823 domain-containing protein n=1 Tax=Parapedobacter luteus TaxID=623280 RepID=A0A1T5BRG2_9SPHI|nr:MULTISPECIES: DUF3823 domain-containing protein [Parapedobacter]MBK1439723.1 DUF3823 domain-containing protein [Parapedobacter sp. ISTM3]SKB49764.1 Protein of unknown function [Parapedobacter luteus]